MWPDDGLSPTIRNIIFFITSGITWSCLLYTWLDLKKHEREEGIYLGLFSTSTILLTFIAVLILVDSITNRDFKREEKAKKDHEDTEMLDRENYREGKNYNREIYGADKFVEKHRNSFCGNSEIFRTFLVAIAATFIFTSFFVTYEKHGNSKHDDAGYIILAIVATLAFVAHLAILGFQFAQRLKIKSVK